MTPPRTLTPIDDESTARHLWECWEADHGPGKKLRDSVDELKTANVTLNATVKTVGRMLSGAVVALTFAVLVLGYMSTRDRDRRLIREAGASAVTIPQAHADERKSP